MAARRYGFTSDLLGLLIGINLFLSGLTLMMTAIACRSVSDVLE